MGSKSKRRHAQKQYNRAQNKPVVTEAAPEVADDTTTTMAPIMTPKELRKAEKERQRNAKRLAKEQAKTKGKDKGKDKTGEKKPFFLIRFFRWIGRTFSEIGSELKKVHWPSFKQIVKSTGIVLAIVVGFGLLLLGIWALLGFLHGLLIGGL